MRIFFIAALAFLVSLPARGEPQIVASIPPVHSLVAGVMEGVGLPHLLVPGGASPHSFALKPSDAHRLEQAQAVFWVGPTLETFLDRPLKALAQKAEVVALIGADGVKRLSFREGGPWEGHDHDADHGAHKEAAAKEESHAHGRHDGHGHDAHHHGEEHGTDAHLWLDPMNAVAFVRKIAGTLGHVDPANKPRYAANAVRLEEKLKALDGNLQRMLAPAKGKPYIVFHDAYQYFEARYGLSPAGSITVSPELSPGAKRLVEIRDRIRNEGALCVFAEPQFEPKLIRTVTKGTGARTATLDPLGARIAPGPEAYFDLMQTLAADLAACLGKRS